MVVDAVKMLLSICLKLIDRLICKLQPLHMLCCPAMHEQGTDYPQVTSWKRTIDKVYIGGIERR